MAKKKKEENKTIRLFVSIVHELDPDVYEFLIEKKGSHRRSEMVRRLLWLGLQTSKNIGGLPPSLVVADTFSGMQAKDANAPKGEYDLGRLGDIDLDDF